MCVKPDLDLGYLTSLVLFSFSCTHLGLAHTMQLCSSASWPSEHRWSNHLTFQTMGDWEVLAKLSQSQQTSRMVKWLNSAWCPDFMASSIKLSAPGGHKHDFSFFRYSGFKENFQQEQVNKPVCANRCLLHYFMCFSGIPEILHNWKTKVCVLTKKVTISLLNQWVSEYYHTI